MNVDRDLADLGLEIRRTDSSPRGREARCDCPFCPRRPDDVRAADPAFACNLTSGAWHCHRCGEKGNMFLLRRRLKGEPSKVFHAARKAMPAPAPGRLIDMAQVEKMHAALFAPEGVAALAYLREARRISEDSARLFRLGFTRRGAAGAIAIPFLAGGRCLGVKYRLLPPGDAQRKYDREAGCTLPLFNVDALAGQFEVAIITEGELDAVALTQYGVVAPVVSIPDGATASLKDDAAAALEHFDEIFIAFDGDEKGDEGAAKIAERLGAFRCRRVRLPRKDANECLMAGVPREDMVAALSGASPCGTSAVKSIASWRDLLLADDSPTARGLATGWVGLDRVLGGLRPGEVTLLTAETGAGKSSWTIDLARRQAALGHAVLVASLELQTIAVARKILSGVAGRLWDGLKGDARKAAVDELCRLPIFLLDRYGEVAIEHIREEVALAVRRHGVTLLVLDHLHFALGVRKSGDDERLMIDGAAQAVQSMALELGIHVVLVMHPAKIRAGEDGRARQPEIGDLKGSSGPAQFADNIFRIARSQGDRAILTALKIRSELGKPGVVAFRFDPASLRFHDVDVQVAAPPRPVRDGRAAAAGEDAEERREDAAA